MAEGTWFHIDTKVVSISLDCPHCEERITIPWKNVDVPESWSDDWGEIECPECGKTIKLGDYEYD